MLYHCIHFVSILKPIFRYKMCHSPLHCSHYVILFS
nr:MAG TPA: hypothetical protein [Caudoviricetes sp.]